MPYIVDTTTGNLGNYNNGGTVDFGTANAQAKERANQNANNTPTKTPTNTSSAKASTTPVNTGVSSDFDYASFLSAQLAAQREAAQNAYNNNMARIADAFGAASGNLRSNYDSTVGRLNAARDKSTGEVRSDAEDSLRQAYINNMLTKKNLDQRLAAMGYNGGATESTMASIANQYGKSRTGINETLNKNLANLEQTYGDNLANALQAYNSAMNNLYMQKMQMEVQAENALQNAQAQSVSGIGSLLNMDQSYLSALTGALNNQNAYTFDPTLATNNFVAGQAQQAASADQGTNYAKSLAQDQLQGTDAESIRNQAFKLYQNGSIDFNTLFNMLKQNGLG